MTFATGLSPPARERLGLDADARRVGGETEGALFGLLRHRVDDASERCADVLGVSAHRAIVEAHSLTAEHLGEPVERDPQAVLRDEHVRDERWREQSSLDEFLRLRHRHELEDGLVVTTVPFARFDGVLVGRARDDDPHGASAPIAVAIALFEADALDGALEHWVGDLDPRLWHLDVAQTASPCRRRARLLRFVVGRRRRRRSRWSLLCVELLRQRIELGLRLGELEFELRRIEPLGLRDEDLPPKQFELLFEQRIARRRRSRSAVTAASFVSLLASFAARVSSPTSRASSSRTRAASALSVALETSSSLTPREVRHARSSVEAQTCAQVHFDRTLCDARCAQRSMHPPSLGRRLRLDLDPIEERLERRVVELDPRRAWRQIAWNADNTFV